MLAWDSITPFGSPVLPLVKIIVAILFILLAFSCKGRSFCPSYNMKRALQFSEWLINEVLEEVTHQQYMFTIPKIIRLYFKYDRHLLGKLCLCAWETIKEFFGACLPKGTVPGAVISIQTWGNMGANFHPHLHGLVSKGAFDAHGVFYPLPWIDTQRMALLFRDKVKYAGGLIRDLTSITKCRSMPMM